MTTRELLIEDYLIRSKKRLLALEFLRDIEAYADVVREAQEVVELLLKALIMMVGLDVPKIHDVSKYIEKELILFPSIVQQNIELIKKISRDLRKDRELSFYGALDWIPSKEYDLEDAQRAINWAKDILNIVEKAYEEVR
ncbi:MAG: HEPN domain-containing protein [Caldimicrobium sp.]|nr:HEPN domain-containing protein [Caldimicrobium sp.]MCX7873253.1 HEPN domain-containing protein [Caldimicrobium sp.]MDW8094682.1 HEPN domain-containing protein [Caldimicrobium sp.]